MKPFWSATRLRQAADHPKLAVAWRFALAGGFVMCDGGRGHGAAAETDWANLPPETVLQRWLDALSAAIPFGSGTERPRDDEHATCIAALLTTHDSHRPSPHARSRHPVHAR
ncbi:hypothetical protein ACWGCW_13745 [Streptomyces sp. NPDC054933]